MRLTAQRILADHLRYQPPARRWWQPRDADLNARHWPGIQLDLTGATLINLNLNGCHVRDAMFREATFTDYTKFDGATFTGSAWFYGATFTGPASFLGAAFAGSSEFRAVTFTGNALFDGVTGLERAELDGVRVAPADVGVTRSWPPAWQVWQGDDVWQVWQPAGWQTLRLAAAGGAGSEPTPEPEG